MFEALDLCLECKSCKAECPSGVDMAKLKAEWLGHYYAVNGVPLRSRLFANIHTLSKWGSAFAPLSNWVLQSGPVRWLMQVTLGIHHERVMPSFARVPFDRWFKRRQAPANKGERGQVVLFHDTFLTYNEPEIGIAATELLEAAGYEVVIVEKRECCGRPMISKGLLRQARANAERNVELLAPYAERGVPIIGCEPSCILTIRDDYPELIPGEAAQAVADATVTLEEFVAQEIEAGTLAFTDDARKVLLHGHCYQKALVGTDAAQTALGAPANYEVEEIPSGCCGMAGSFGYEHEHFELSQQIGELALLPAVREAGEDVEIVAAGTSCRHQIALGTGREARHPALVLREALRTNGR
jgi:Fe-S oxidoreductase